MKRFYFALSDDGRPKIDTVYAIIIAYSYFREFGLGAEYHEGLISQFC